MCAATADVAGLLLLLLCHMLLLCVLLLLLSLTGYCRQLHNGIIYAVQKAADLLLHAVPHAVSYAV